MVLFLSSLSITVFGYAVFIDFVSKLFLKINFMLLADFFILIS